LWAKTEPHLLHVRFEEKAPDGTVIPSDATYSGTYTVWWLMTEE